ncbi:MAG: YbjQ family protein [Peptococcaceae bacterium]
MMILVNTETIPGREILEVVGLVKGSTIRAKHVGKDILSGLKHLVGGELTEYEEMLREARQIAVNRMAEEAEAKGAGAVVNIRFTSASISQGAAEVLVYGTAVKIK